MLVGADAARQPTATTDQERRAALDLIAFGALRAQLFFKDDITKRWLGLARADELLGKCHHASSHYSDEPVPLAVVATLLRELVELGQMVANDAGVGELRCVDEARKARRALQCLEDGDDIGDALDRLIESLGDE
jgi:hypothetical protein